MRNIFRHKGRFFLSTFVIAIASLMLVTATCQIGGVKQALVRGMTDTLTGHLQIKAKESPREFFDATSGRRISMIQPAELRELLQRVSQVEGVAAAAPRLRFSALIGNGESSTPALVMALDPVAEAKVTTDMAPLYAKMLSNPQAALVSPHLIKKSGVGIGKEILVLSETPDENVNGRPYDIVGLAESPVLIDEYMNMMFMINIERARKMIYVDEIATEIAIRVKPGYEERLEEVRNRVQAVFSKEQKEVLGVYTYLEVAKAINSVGNIATGMAAIQVGVVMFIMLIIVLIVTRMGLFERRAEIGTLMSLGMTRSRLLQLFLSEITIKVMIGYLAGMLVALFILTGIQKSGGIKAATLVEQFMNGGKILVPVIDPVYALSGFALVISTSLLITFFSCWKSGSQDAIELLSGRK
ncbi:FtsX-like permease family protein [Massilia sp. W12]|uniref:ABC transporter permease n=1 Tax=Massilia sp. W12 TaxID=3126507 RepID=UPI0030D426A5